MPELAFSIAVVALVANAVVFAAVSVATALTIAAWKAGKNGKRDRGVRRHAEHFLS